ncbi:hypothetical protein ONE63_008198 [Megalurothrips usitatus]|uniref:Uncharacterized protein n=1 Tax=Megalurothrips usitatus TaxID=439358 RepID=A0AAV7XSA0_9NEOP|nr:hypothetical protein ONE63_008198 [Megalurothrips usitatus]
MSCWREFCIMFTLDNDCGDGDEGDEISDDTGTAVPSSEMKRSRAVTPNKTVLFSLSPVTQSPAAKVRRAGDLTPGSKLVVEALMSLPQTFPSDNLQLAQHHPKVSYLLFYSHFGHTFVYAISKLILCDCGFRSLSQPHLTHREDWAVRASVQKEEAKKSARKELTRMLDFSDFSDLGVSPTNYTDRNNNSLNNSFEIADSVPDHSGIFPLNSGGNEFDVSIVADNSSVAAPENAKSSPNNRFVNESEMHTDICDACGSSLKYKLWLRMNIEIEIRIIEIFMVRSIGEPQYGTSEHRIVQKVFWY